MDIDQIYSELLLRIQGIEALCTQVDSHVFQTFNFLWAVIIGVFAIIGVALYFIAQQTAEKGLKKYSQGLQEKIDNYEKRIATLESELGETNKQVQDVVEYHAKVEYGSYLGNGTFGLENKTTLNFLFPPRLMLVFLMGSSQPSAVFLRPSPYFLKGQPEQGSVKLCPAWEGNDISWYSTIDATSQLNKLGEIYSFVVIG